ncbi:MAG TPA: Maf family protein [Pyrinomonadaceae bacterium]|jgi:septum formation protein|nr:Maf family protein [Pyrinomonadaceae bacterium]
MANQLCEKLILASGSPRRKELLTAVGWEFEAITAGIDESVRPGEDPARYVQRLALAKAEAVALQLEHGLVLGADTTVVVDDQILGQPVDDADANRMLKLLNAKWHEVLTGVAVVRVGGESRVEYETTRVRFAEMSEREIEWYISTGEARGKAGAYGIQGAAGLFIEEIEGDYFNIVGLPIRLVYELIKH